MFKVARVTAVFGAVALCASTATADSDSPTRTRVTIRGTGNSVTIERTSAPARRLSDRLPPGPLGDAIAMKFGGADDASVIAFLRRRQGDLPPVIEAADVRLLRKAGAGKSLTNFLASLSAVDLGPTGERPSTDIVVAPLPPSEISVPEYGMSYGYGMAGGFGYAPVLPGRSGHRPFPPLRHVRLRLPIRVPPAIVTRAAVGRFPDSP